LAVRKVGRLTGAWPHQQGVAIDAIENSDHYIAKIDSPTGVVRSAGWRHRLDRAPSREHVTVDVAKKLGPTHLNASSWRISQV